MRPGVYGIQYTDKDGKRRREKAGTFEDALKLLRIRVTESIRNRPRKDLTYTARDAMFKDLVNDAEIYMHQKLRSAKSGVRTYLAMLNDAFGDKWAEDINKRKVEEWLNNTAQEREWSASTKNVVLSIFSTVFRLGIENGKATHNPCRGVKRERVNNMRVRYLTQDEERRLTAVIEKRYPELLPLVILSIHTGVRFSEMLRIKVGDYNEDARTLTVHQTKYKNGPPIRHVPLTPMALEAYRTLCTGLSEGKLIARGKDGHLLSKSMDWFISCLKEADIAEYTWHCNRHTFASRLVMRGVPLPAVGLMMGHSSTEMTMRYAHLQPHNADQAIDAMMKYYE